MELATEVMGTGFFDCSIALQCSVVTNDWAEYHVY